MGLAKTHRLMGHILRPRNPTRGCADEVLSHEAIVEGEGGRRRGEGMEEEAGTVQQQVSTNAHTTEQGVCRRNGQSIWKWLVYCEPSEHVWTR